MVKRKKALKLTYVISNIITVILISITLYLSIRIENIAFIFPMTYLLIIRYRENRKYKLKSKIYKKLENYIAINK